MPRLGDSLIARQASSSPTAVTPRPGVRRRDSRLAGLQRHFDHNEGHIIDRLVIGAEGEQSLADSARNLFSRLARRLADCFAKPFLAELLTACVRHFPNAIGADDDDLTR